MKFHWPSFVLGVAAGAAGAALWDRFRPFLVELATGGYELAEAALGRIAMVQEDTEDVLAEARQRVARRARPRGAAVRRRARGRR